MTTNIVTVLEGGESTYSDYKTSIAYQRSNRPLLDQSGRVTSKSVWPLPPMTKGVGRG